MGVARAFFLGAQIGLYLVASSVAVVNSPAYQEWQTEKAQKQTQDVYMYATADEITTSADVPGIAVVTTEKWSAAR